MSPARTLVFLVPLVVAVAPSEVAAVLLPVIGSTSFGLLLIAVGIAAPIALRIDRLDRQYREERALLAAATPPLPRQRMREGAWW